MKKNNKQRGWKIDRERAEQISNNVSEEYIDLGLINFATKEELCETIMWLNRIHTYQYQHLQGALTGTLTHTLKSLANIHIVVDESIARDIEDNNKVIY